MKLYGLLVAQNEADIIEDTLSHLRRLNVFERIFFFDLGSEDDTLSKAQHFADLLHEPQRLDAVYTEGLRFDLLASHRSFFKDGDWLAIVDADELYAEDPRPLIEAAERENANCIGTYQAEFMLTDVDLAALDDETSADSIVEQRRHYLIQWSEKRFYKFLPSEGLLSDSRPSARRLLNRHYQYRSPKQIELRIRTRMANRITARNLPRRQKWPQIFSPRWQDYVVRHQLLHRDDGGPLRFGLPEGVQWKDYYSRNPFSTVFPLVATALLRQRTGVPHAGDGAAGLLRDDYRRHVIQEVGINMRAGRWAGALCSLGVLLRYLSRWSRRTLVPLLEFWLGRGAEVVRGRLLRLARRLGGKSYGWISAVPNPIARPHLSWQGITTIRWRASSDSVEVRIGSPDGRLFASGGRAGSATTGPWVDDEMEFYLQDVSRGKALHRDHTLGRVRMGVFCGPYIEAD